MQGECFSGHLWLTKLLFRQWWRENEPSELIYRRWTCKFMSHGDLWTFNKLMSSFFDGMLLDLSRRGYSKWVFDGKLLDLSRGGWSFCQKTSFEVIPNGSLDYWIFRAEDIKTRRGGCLSSNDCYENDGSNSSRDGSRRDLCSRACFLLL